jgi:hypothetical protein
VILSPKNSKELDRLARERRQALASGRKTDAAAIMLQIDDLLDSRDHPIAVALDGEILWPGAPPWQVAQATIAQERAKPAGPMPDPFTPEEKAKLILQSRRELGVPGYER